MMRNSKFYGQDGKRYWGGLDEETSVKLLAKMFREITHMKPPRGRPGRHLPFEGHFAVEASGASYTQGPYTADDELHRIENKGERNYRSEYNQGSGAKEEDLNRLARWHKRYENKKVVENTVGSLQDLIQGLMGLGMKKVQYEEIGYSEKQYQATMYLDGFIIIIKKWGEDD